MMYYQEYRPRKALQGLIACYWTIHFDEGLPLPNRDLVLPDGCSELIINSGSPFHRYDPICRNTCSIEDYALVGQRRSAIEISQTSSTRFFAIRFKPQSLQTLIPVDCSEITGQILTDRKLRQYFVEPLRRLLCDKPVTAALIQEVEQLLMSRLDNNVVIRPCVAQAVNEIVQARGQFNVAEFCKRFGLHDSTLQKNFLIQVGLSPKEYASIIRFNNTFSRLKSGNYQSLTAAALDSGFYDQSHMIRDFKRYTGLAPTRFLKSNFILPQIALSINKSLHQYFAVA